MPRTLYEILTLFEASKKYEAAINTVESEEEKNFYENLYKNCTELIFYSSNIIGFSQEEIAKFYYQMQKGFFENIDKTSLIDNIQTILTILQDKQTVLSTFSKFDALSEDAKHTYCVMVSDKPLFDKIMGEKAMEHKLQLEQIIGETLDIEKAENSIVKLGPIANTWYNKLEDAYKNGKLDEKQNADYKWKLDYIINYYWGIFKGKFEELEPPQRGEFNKRG